MPRSWTQDDFWWSQERPRNDYWWFPVAPKQYDWRSSDFLCSHKKTQRSPPSLQTRNLLIELITIFGDRKCKPNVLVNLDGTDHANNSCLNKLNLKPPPSFPWLPSSLLRKELRIFSVNAVLVVRQRIKSLANVFVSNGVEEIAMYLRWQQWQERSKVPRNLQQKKQDVISDYVGARSFRILITPSKYHWFRCDGAWGWGCGVWGEGWEEGYKTTRTTTTSQRRIAVGPLSCVNNNTSDPVLHKISVIFFMQSCYWWAHIVPSVFVAQGSQDFSWNPMSFSVFLYDPKLTQQWFVMIQGSAQDDHWWSQGRC